MLIVPSVLQGHFKYIHDLADIGNMPGIFVYKKTGQGSAGHLFELLLLHASSFQRRWQTQSPHQSAGAPQGSEPRIAARPKGVLINPCREKLEFTTGPAVPTLIGYQPIPRSPPYNWLISLK